MRENCKSASMSQVKSKINQLVESKGLIFQDAFSNDELSGHLRQHFPEFRDRVYSPTITLFAFLSQMLSADRSCSETVARVNAERVAQGLAPASANNSAYVKARERIPEAFLHELTTHTGQAMEDSAPMEWLWRGRHVKLVDGSTLTMADTPENQAVYGQISSQELGLGFPISRILAIFSLATGSVLDFANGPYQGKQTGEHALLRQLLHCFKPGDLVIGDAYFPSYFLIAILQQMQVDCLFTFDGKRKMDFRAGERLGKKDHAVFWQKPQRPDWMQKDLYDPMPEAIRVRECTVGIERSGFRSTSMVLVTTMLDSSSVNKQELGWLYAQRWMAEISLAAIKTTLKMEHLRVKTPEMVRKEIWATLLAYNLIRKLIGQAAYQYHLLPREISFKGTLQHLNAFRPLWLHPGLSNQLDITQIILTLISQLRVSNRPGRVEPRAIKKRPRPFPHLRVPRKVAQEQIMRGRMR